MKRKDLEKYCLDINTKWYDIYTNGYFPKTVVDEKLNREIFVSMIKLIVNKDKKLKSNLLKVLKE